MYFRTEHVRAYVRCHDHAILRLRKLASPLVSARRCTVANAATATTAAAGEAARGLTTAGGTVLSTTLMLRITPQFAAAVTGGYAVAADRARRLRQPLVAISRSCTRRPTASRARANRGKQHRLDVSVSRHDLLYQSRPPCDMVVSQLRPPLPNRSLSLQPQDTCTPKASLVFPSSLSHVPHSFLSGCRR